MNKTDGNNWYVYKHIREDLNQVFYIGIGCKKNYGRAYEFRSDKRNIIWCRIHNKTSIRVEISNDNLNKIEAAKIEQELIKLYGRVDLNEGILCNMTDGGDGIWNCKRSDETRKKLSLCKIGDKNPQYGKTPSDETKLKRSISSTGNKRSDETKLKQSLSTIKSGQAKTTIVSDYNSGTYIGTYHSMSEACRQVGLDPMKHSSHSSEVANGKRKHVNGYSFKYDIK